MALVAPTPQTLVTTYLEMTNPAQFRPAYAQDSRIEIVPMAEPDVPFYRFLYRAVGEKYRWRDRLAMSNNALRSILRKPTTHVHVLYVNGMPAGYVELDEQRDGSVEIAYFGLREQFHGMGLGKHLLSYGIEQAWELGARRIHLHTCNLDGQHALRNYEKRGFRVYRRDEEPMPDIYQ